MLPDRLKEIRWKCILLILGTWLGSTPTQGAPALGRTNSTATFPRWGTRTHLGYRFSILNAVDPVNQGEAKLLSKYHLNTSFDLSWRPKSAFSPFIGVQAQVLSFLPANQLEVSSAALTPWGVRFGADLSVNSRLRIQPLLLLQKQILIAPVSGNSLPLEQITQGSAGMTLDWLFKPGPGYPLGIVLGGRIVLPHSGAPFEVSTGFGYSARLHTEFPSRTARIGLEIFYEALKQSTSFQSQTLSSFGLDLIWKTPGAGSSPASIDPKGKKQIEPAATISEKVDTSIKLRLSRKSPAGLIETFDLKGEWTWEKNRELPCIQPITGKDLLTETLPCLREIRTRIDPQGDQSGKPGNRYVFDILLDRPVVIPSRSCDQYGVEIESRMNVGTFGIVAIHCNGPFSQRMLTSPGLRMKTDGKSTYTLTDPNNTELGSFKINRSR